MESYAERLPIPALSRVVRTVWVQRTGADPVPQRHLPTGGVEIHIPVGGRARLIGPLTGPAVEVLPPRTTVVGVRFLPGAAPPLVVPLEDLVDRRVDLVDVWPEPVARIEDAVLVHDAEAAMGAVQQHLLAQLRRTAGLDALVREAALLLMPWSTADVSATAERLSLSTSQLRRRCLHRVGLNPKALQRTLRFQGFLALAQSGAGPSGRLDRDGVAGLAADAGYADQAHLARECLRLTGLTPTELLRGSVDRCGCGHDHGASFRPFLALRTAGAA